MFSSEILTKLLFYNNVSFFNVLLFCELSKSSRLLLVRVTSPVELTAKCEPDGDCVSVYVRVPRAPSSGSVQAREAIKLRGRLPTSGDNFCKGMNISYMYTCHELKLSGTPKR